MTRERVSISQLKGSLASYLAKVEAGCSLVITERDIGIAVLSPVSWGAEEEAMRDLILSGQVTPPSGELPEDFFEGPKVKDPGCSLRRFLIEDLDEG